MRVAFPPVYLIGHFPSLRHVQGSTPTGVFKGRCRLFDIFQSGLPIPLFIFCSKPIESGRMTACVLRLSPLEAIQRRAWVTASTSIVKLEVETVQAALSSWMVVTPCLTVKPYPDWSLVTEPSVYAMRSCGFAVFLDQKLDL